jgi:hypothetical protein
LYSYGQRKGPQKRKNEIKVMLHSSSVEVLSRDGQMLIIIFLFVVNVRVSFQLVREVLRKKKCLSSLKVEGCDPNVTGLKPHTLTLTLSAEK